MDFKPDKIIIGHNQFFGVDHMSSARGAKRAQFFSNMENVKEILVYAVEQGATGLMLSTHPRAKEIAEVISNHEILNKNLNIYILLPYVAKYVRMANEKGMLNMITDSLKDSSFKDKIGIALSGGLGFLKKDQLSMLKSLIDLEMLPYQKLKIKAILLHNNLTDLNVGLGFHSVIDFFHNYILEKYQCKPGFCTLNYSKLVYTLGDLKINNPLVMAPFNPIGFQMNPSIKACEDALENNETYTIAMSILAAGSLSPGESTKYLKHLSKIQSFIIGASSKYHIKESYDKIKSL